MRAWITYTVVDGEYVSPWGPPDVVTPTPEPPDPTPDYFILDDPASSLDGPKVMV